MVCTIFVSSILNRKSIQYSGKVYLKVCENLYFIYSEFYQFILFFCLKFEFEVLPEVETQVYGRLENSNFIR